MIGACDICNAQNVEIAHGFASGLETFYCVDGCPPNAKHVEGLRARVRALTLVAKTINAAHRKLRRIDRNQ